MRSFILSICAVVTLALTACVREHVDLNRPCASDADCIQGYACQNGLCTTTAVQATCQLGAPEICDGIDNDCDGLVDEGFECALGSQQSCDPNPGTRYCIPGCTYSACFTDWYDGHFPQRILLTIPSGSTTAALTDVPVPIRLTTAQFTTEGVDPTSLSTDGHDIAITDKDSNPLPLQIESWDAARGYVVWVQLASLPTDADVSFYLYLGNTNGTDPSTPSVWDSGFVGVWHLAETGDVTSFIDATGHANNAAGRAAENASASIGSGQTIDAGHGLRASSVEIPVGSSLTIEGWITAKAEAYHYRRPLNATPPEDDFEVEWILPTSPAAFVSRVGDIATVAVIDSTDTIVPYTGLETNADTELWYRVASASNPSPSLLYGDPSATDLSNASATFHLWAYGDSWSQFKPDPILQSSTDSEEPTSIIVTSGRAAVTLPFDLRDGYFVQTYADTTPPTDGGTDASGAVPLIASTTTPSLGSPTTDSLILVEHYRPLDEAGVRSSNGGAMDVEHGGTISPVFGDIGVAVYQGAVNVYADESFVGTLISDWVNPLNVLAIGSQDGTSVFYPTTYRLMFARKYLGSNVIASLGDERVNGLSIGDFGISVGPSAVYLSTRDGITVINEPASGPASVTHHVALVVDASSYTLFIDGVSASSASVSAHGDLKGFHLIDARALSGVLDEVRVSNIVRAPEWLSLEVRSARAGFMTIGQAQTLH